MSDDLEDLAERGGKAKTARDAAQSDAGEQADARAAAERLELAKTSTQRWGFLWPTTGLGRGYFCFAWVLAFIGFVSDVNRLPILVAIQVAAIGGLALLRLILQLRYRRLLAWIAELPFPIRGYPEMWWPQSTRAWR